MAMRVIVVGSGIAGATVAAALARALPRETHGVTLVDAAGDDDGVGGFGPALATLPYSREIHPLLGLSEEALIAGAGASFALGSAWSGWSASQPAYFLPFGDVGAPMGSVAFHQLLAKSREGGGAQRLANYSVAAVAAQLGRFARPAEDRRSILSSYSYALHLDRARYARLLLDAAAPLRARGRFAAAELGADGSIAAVRLDNGERIEGDLFIDCTGAKALLIGDALGTPFESCTRWLPCDRAMGVMCEGDAPPPYSHVAAHGAGWRRSVPIAGGSGECFAWSSEHLSDDAAPEALMAELAGRPLGEPVAFRFEQGRRSRAWSRNCVAIGSAAGMLEPLAAGDLQTLHAAVARLIALFPSSARAEAEAAEYNRLTAAEFDRLRDFAILSYKLNGRTGERYWDALRATPVPEELGYKIELYASRGRLALLDEETFEDQDWVALFGAHGVQPRRYDPLADAIPSDQIANHLDRLKQMTLNAAAGLPAHGDYLRAQRATAR